MSPHSGDISIKFAGSNLVPVGPGPSRALLLSHSDIVTSEVGVCPIFGGPHPGTGVEPQASDMYVPYFGPWAFIRPCISFY